VSHAVPATISLSPPLYTHTTTTPPQCKLRMAADGMGGRDAASLLSSLATLQHTPR
jgi:hypothetical protein